MSSPVKIAIVGSGPAGLMAATSLLRASNAASRFEIHLFEKRAGLGRKLLIAGSSGLNISHGLRPGEFASHYEGFSRGYWQTLFESYGQAEWVRFIEKDLGLETFLGTSNRYFVREMKASGLLKCWTEYLRHRGVHLHANSELVDFASDTAGITLKFKPLDTSKIFAKVIFALGGASWETETPAWAKLFADKEVEITPFTPSNVGYEVDWNEKFLAESEGKPLKKIELETSRGKKLGELVVTKYGLEGTPIYFCGIPGPAFLDLKPDLSAAEIFEKLSSIKENFSPVRRVKHYLALSEAAESLIFHHTATETKNDLAKLIAQIKRFPLRLKNPRPLSESISSRGGIALPAVDKNLQLIKFPNAYCIGEMLDWDAPTGGFLIQAAVSQGAQVGKLLSQEITQTIGNTNS
jgi:uncharacterized flavoprotein (TIGR03862 family)